MKQTKDIVIALVVGVVVLGGIVWFAKPFPSSPTSGRTGSDLAAMLVAPESSFDFGTISMAAGNVSRRFPIQAAANETAVVEKIYTSCMCTTATLLNGENRFGPYGMPGHGFIPKLREEIKPGGEAVIEVVFDPAAHGPAGIGPVERSVIVETTSGGQLELRFRAVVTP